MSLLTIGYLTSRSEPKFEWFINSLQHELVSLGPARPEVQLIVIDTRLWYDDEQVRRDCFQEVVPFDIPFEHHPPKPSVWQGPTRLTQFDFFCAANARNTVFCYARGEHVAFADDLSVLMPGWASGHLHAMKHRYVMCGSTCKWKNLVIEDGRLTSFDPFPPGEDHRIREIRVMRADTNIPCTGHWLFGGTFSVPLEAALSVNGQDEIYDGIGGEDYDFGVRLERAGWKLFFNKNCATVESEELHHGYQPMARIDKPVPFPEPRGPYSSNELWYRLTRSTSTWTMNPHAYVLKELREKVLRGEPFPIPTAPSQHWVDGQPLAEMKHSRNGY